MNLDSLTGYLAECKESEKKPTFNGYEPFKILYEGGIITNGSVVCALRELFLVAGEERLVTMNAVDPLYNPAVVLDREWTIEYLPHKG